MHEPKRYRILVSGACGVTSRSVVRALKKSTRFGNSCFIGTDVFANLYGLVEGEYHEIYRVPRCDHADYGSTIKDICNRERIDLALVIPELEVLYWTQNELPVPCLLPPQKFCAIAGSKSALHEALRDTGLVPDFMVADRDSLGSNSFQPHWGWPSWIRECELGSTSGRGSLLVHGSSELRAWMELNAGVDQFMISEYLPGRNLACHLLYFQGTLLRTGIYERLEYFMGRISPSGVSGNISRGRLLNDPRVLDCSTNAISTICRKTGELMNGLVAVDLREDSEGIPRITEINLRHVACTSAFADAGNNLAEAQVSATLGMIDQIETREVLYPPGNLILRDIDGRPAWIKDLALPEIGQPLRRLS